MSQTIPSVYGLTKDIIKVDKTKWTYQQRTTKKKILSATDKNVVNPIVNHPRKHNWGSFYTFYSQVSTSYPQFINLWAFFMVYHGLPPTVMAIYQL